MAIGCLTFHRFRLLVGFGVFALLALSVTRAYAQPKSLALSDQPLSIHQETLSFTGSDTLSPLINLWAQVLARQAPWLKLQIQASGSATAPIALALGTSMLGTMSRQMTPIEALRIRQVRGRDPIEWPLALDAIVFYVHPINPLTTLSTQDIERLFAQTPLCYPGPRINRWRDLEPFLTPKQSYSVQEAKAAMLLAQREPYLVGRNSISGTHHYVRNKVLCGGFFRTGMAELPSAASVIQTIAREPNAVGYASWGAHLNTVKALAVDQIAPTQNSIRQQHYSWTRKLYVYVMTEADQSISKGLWTTLSWIYSQAGQKALLDLGFVSLPRTALQAIRKQLSTFKQPQWEPLFDVDGQAFDVDGPDKTKEAM
jgi:phosphate transport system substrate-binding protein